MNKPLVSIITAAYNSEAYISSAIHSVIEQTYKNWEHIIINDGSTDETAQCIKTFKDNRIKYHYQENKGVGSARNAGIERMKGDYFCFLDADDYFLPESLETRLKIFEKDPSISFVDGRIGIYDRNLVRLKWLWEPAFRGNPLSELLSLNGSCFFGPSWMIKRDQTRQYHFHERMTHGEDLLFYLEAAYAGGLYDFTDEVILRYRKGHHSAMKDLGGLEKGYRYIYRHLRLIGIKETEAEKFKRKAQNIIFRSYLGHFKLLNAYISMFRKW